MIVCPSCGTSCARTSRHCPNCGARLDAAPPASIPAAGIPPTTSHASLSPGSLLNGRYAVKDILGSGAFGRVYLAEDAQDPHSPPVAIKELLDAQFTSPQDKQEAISWFKREVSILLSLEHPSIPMIHGYWTAHRTAGPFYLAMDYIPGKTLEQVLQDSGGRVHWRAVVDWGAALCDVLTYLHGRTPPFVFRDLKLSNVMLDNRTGQPVLIDFGITRQIAAVGGTAIGTWGYVPYEQILGKAEPRSDVYALGATLHALLSGRHPDAEYTRLQRTGLDVEGTLRALFPPVDSLVPDVPPALAHALRRATAFAPDDRFASAAAMAATLRQVTSPAATVMVPPQPLPTRPTTAPVVAPPQPLGARPARAPVVAASAPPNLVPSAHATPAHVPPSYYAPPSYWGRAWLVTLLYLFGWWPGAIVSLICWWQYRQYYKATGLRPAGSRWLAFQFWCFTVGAVVLVVIAAIVSASS
jgi:serine/threonine protein kinase